MKVQYSNVSVKTYLHCSKLQKPSVVRLKPARSFSRNRKKLLIRRSAQMEQTKKPLAWHARHSNDHVKNINRPSFKQSTTNVLPSLPAARRYNARLQIGKHKRKHSSHTAAKPIVALLVRLIACNIAPTYINSN